MRADGSASTGQESPAKDYGREVSLMGQNIWLVLIVIFIILVLLGVITVATR